MIGNVIHFILIGFVVSDVTVLESFIVDAVINKKKIFKFHIIFYTVV